MHILLTTPYPVWPIASGGAVRTTQLARGLRALGHRITLLSADPAGPAGEIGRDARWFSFPRRGQRGHFWNRGFIDAYTRALTPDIDLIVAGFPYQAFMLVGPARRAGVPLVYDAHNVEHDRFQRMGGRARALLVRLTEAHMTRNAGEVLVVSKEDAALMKETYGRECRLLPNGVDLERFSPGSRSAELLSRYGLDGQRVVLFFGPCDYPPNLDALRFLVDRLWPAVMQARIDARLLVVGREPPEWVHGRRGIVVTGEVEDIVAHIRLADLVVAPITGGGGTRLKILEALACGQRVVSTPFGATGIAAASGQGLILASLQEFQGAVLDALDDPKLAPRQQQGARELAGSFDWGRNVAGIDWSELARRPRR